MPKIELRLKLRLLPILVAVLILFQFLGTYKGLRVLLVGLGGAWLIGYLWARFLARGLRLRRELRFGWVQVGDWMVERFNLRNDSRLPALWVEVVDHSTLPDYQASRAVGVSSGGSIWWFKETVCTLRGLFTLGPVTLRTGDPFGLYSVTLEYPTSIPLLVMPPIVPLPALEVAAGGRAREGRTMVNGLERTVSASYVREFQPGDHRRWIHWPTTARMDSLYVRLFDGAPSGDWWILLDMNSQVHFGDGFDSTEEHQVILAASLADRGLRSGRAVGLIASEENPIWLPPKGGESQRWQILRSLAMVRQGDTPLAKLLTRIRPILGRGASLAIITPAVKPSWVEALIPLIDQGVIPTVLLLDPQSFGAVGEAGAIQSTLTDQGVIHYLITRDWLDGVSASLGIGPREEVSEISHSIVGWAVLSPSGEPELFDWGRDIVNRRDQDRFRQSVASEPWKVVL